MNTSEPDPEVPSSHCCLLAQALAEPPWAPIDMEQVPTCRPRRRGRENAVARASLRDVEPLQPYGPSLARKTTDSSLSVASCKHRRRASPGWPSDGPFPAGLHVPADSGTWQHLFPGCDSHTRTEQMTSSLCRFMADSQTHDFCLSVQKTMTSSARCSGRPDAPLQVRSPAAFLGQLQHDFQNNLS